TGRSSSTASIWARTTSGTTGCTARTPRVFWTVRAVITAAPYTAKAWNVFRSAWIPAPPLGSEPATLSATGIAGPRTVASLRCGTMQLEVYQTDVEVYEAAAALAAERLTAAAAAGRATVAVPGGRGGRAVMLALAARGDLPW